MDYQERLEFLSEIQETLPVNEWRIDGIRIWPFILHEINIALTKNIVGQDIVDKKSTLSLIKSELIATIKYQYQAIKDRYSNNSSSEKSDIVCLTQAARRVLFQDIYTGHSISALPIALICFAFLFSIGQFAMAALLGAIGRLRQRVT